MRIPLVLAVLPLLFAGCSQAGSGLPTATQVDPVASNALRFAVGTATISWQGQSAVGLNVVETLRQANGLSGTLFNVPFITGPQTFSISNPVITSPISPPIQTLARADAGSNRISQQSFDTQQATGYQQQQPFATSGAFGYGICACNANAEPLTGTPQLFHAYNLPLYAVLPFGASQGGSGLANLRYYGGPPAFPAAPPGVAAAGFLGYSIGFVDFAVAPVAGSYRLDVALPPDFTTSINSSTPTLTATAALKNAAGLPPFATPSFVSDGRGGGSITIDVPAGVTESMIFIQEGNGAPYCSGTTTPAYYTLLVRSGGQQVVTLADKAGPADANGNPTATLCANAPYYIYAVGFDYPAYEAAYPQSTAQSPAIVGAGGQADVTTSDAFAGVYQ